MTHGVMKFNPRKSRRRNRKKRRTRRRRRTRIKKLKEEKFGKNVGINGLKNMIRVMCLRSFKGKTKSPSIADFSGQTSGKIHTGISGPKMNRTIHTTEELSSAEKRMVSELRCVAVTQNTTVFSRMI